MEQQDLIQKQIELSQQIKVLDFDPKHSPKQGDTILALDIQYAGEQACVAGDLQVWQGEHFGIYTGIAQTGLAYQPGLFSFREGPPLYDFVKYLERQTTIKPDFIVVDGHGIAHHRKFGVASWLGLALEMPTLGCAKDTLLQYAGELGIEKGSKLPIYLENELVGYALRSQAGVKPIFVSVGHLLDLESSVLIINALVSEFRIPDMLRRADQAARNLAKNLDNFTISSHHFGQIPKH